MSEIEIAKAYELQKRRKFWIGVEGKLTKSFWALICGALYDGRRPEEIEDKERKAIQARADAIVGKVVSGKPMDDGVIEWLATDAIAFKAAVDPVKAARRKIELEMEKVARRLPCYAFAKGVKGFGDMGYCVLIGETGDLRNYDRHDKVWKRLGLAPHDGKAYSTWRYGKEGSLTAEQWTDAGYAPRRRAEVYAVIQDPLFRHQTASSGPYRSVYDERRARSTEAHPDWKPDRLHKDAGRVMVQKLVRHLWAEWRRASDDLPSRDNARAPAATSFTAPSALTSSPPS